VNIEYDKQQAPNVPDFVDGMRDCEKGNQADPDRSDSYQRGYAAEYQLEANMEGKSDEQERIYC
jgi:hypothetical protein